MSYGQQPQPGQYAGGYYPNYSQPQGMYPVPPGAFGHLNAHYPYPPQGGYLPGVPQQQPVGQGGYVPPPQFTGFFMDDYNTGEEAMEEDDDDEQDEEEVVQVSEEIANMVLKRAAIQLLNSQGFKNADKATLNILVHETIAYMENLYDTARQYADLAGNAKPSGFDVLAALDEQGVTAESLNPRKSPRYKSLDGEVVPRNRGKKRKRKIPGDPVVFDTGDISDPEPAFDGDEIPHVPQTFRGPPYSHYLPQLPAKHTYLCSPPSPPQRSTLSLSVEKKLQNTAQVRNALKSLMDATDDPAESEPASPAMAIDTLAPATTPLPSSDEKTGAPQEPAPATPNPPINPPVIPPRSYKLKPANIVNWQESFAMTRKRWKVTAH